MKFSLYWLDGTKEVIEGNTLSEAFVNAGYTGGATTAIDFYDEGTNNFDKYHWNSISNTWDLEK